MAAYKNGRDVEKRLRRKHHVGAFRVMASMQQGMGQHLVAIDYINEALGQEDNDQVCTLFPRTILRFLSVSSSAKFSLVKWR